jgi:CDP-diacylglycerol--glycerol-3-phosphate 3-phosphatidyltransferase
MLTRAIPNLLGLFRILATPVMVYLILRGTPAGYVWAAVLLVLMAISDLLDGQLARRLNVVSPLGIFLDTISDKIFVTGALLPLIAQDRLSVWIALLIIVRDFAVSGLRSFASAEGVVIPAGAWGKQKLVITVVALTWLLLDAHADLGGWLGMLFGGWLGTLFGLWFIPMALAVIWTAASGVEYFYGSWTLLRESWSPRVQRSQPAGLPSRARPRALRGRPARRLNAQNPGEPPQPLPHDS